MIEQLIDRLDTFELARDQIAQILADNVANQQALAVLAGKDPEPWRLKVYTERARPWEAFQNQPAQDRAPIVNVWYSDTRFNPAASNVVERQMGTATFNVDIVAMGTSISDGSGQKTGDQIAAYDMQKALRLVRSILMAAEYTYLNLRGLVGQRWTDATTTFQPDSSTQSSQNIIGGRLVLSVILNEFAPQIEGNPLESVAVDVKRAEDGQVLARAEYVYN